MSRSRKKTAGCCDRNPVVKRKFNRSVRRKLKQAKLLETEEGWFDHDGYHDYWYSEQHMSFDIQNGNAYKRLNCSWDICDWKGLWYGGYQEYKKQLIFWKQHYPQWPDFYADTWYREIMK